MSETKIKDVNQMYLDVVWDAIDFQHPDLSLSGINTSDNLEDPIGDLKKSIESKFYDDSEIFSLTDEEALFAFDCLLKYRDALNSLRSSYKKGTAKYKNIHKSLKMIPLAISKVFPDIQIRYRERDD